MKTLKLEKREDINYSLNNTKYEEVNTDRWKPLVTREATEITIHSHYGEKVTYTIIRSYCDNTPRFSLYPSIDAYLNDAPPIVRLSSKKFCIRHACLMSDTDREFSIRAASYGYLKNKAEALTISSNKYHSALKAINQIVCGSVNNTTEAVRAICIATGIDKKHYYEK